MGKFVETISDMVFNRNKVYKDLPLRKPERCELGSSITTSLTHGWTDPLPKYEPIDYRVLTPDWIQDFKIVVLPKVVYAFRLCMTEWRTPTECIYSTLFYAYMQLNDEERFVQLINGDWYELPPTLTTADYDLIDKIEVIQRYGELIPTTPTLKRVDDRIKS